MRKLYPTYCKLIATLLLLGCSIALSAQGKTYHVKADSEITTSGNNGLSWAQAITLTEALSQAKAGDEIWVKGYEDITGHIYKAPKGGFVLPSVPCRCMEVLQETKPSRTISLRADTNIR